MTIEDFIEAAFKKKIPAKKGAFIAKSLSILYGALSFALVSTLILLLIIYFLF